MAQLYSQGQIQKTSQKQIQRMSQKQIQAVRFLTLSARDLREEIYREVEENPALEIVEDVSVNGELDSFSPRPSLSSSYGMTSEEYEKALENIADETETLQEHLLFQLNSMNLPADVNTFCTQLIYNLDKNGCFGSGLDPKSFLDRTNPYHDEKFIKKCTEIVQRLDPIGCCAKNPEDSLLVQANILDPKQRLAIFILDGHLDFISPPEVSKTLKKIKDFQKAWHSKAFASELPLDKIRIDEEAVNSAINFILSLNPHPASGFVYDSSKANIQVADVALIVERKTGSILSEDFEKGLVKIDDRSFFEVKTPSGYLPKLRIVPLFQKKSEKKEVQAFREKYLNKANDFIGNLQFRESSIILQGCAIVQKQKEFFLKGPGNLNPLTRRKIAQIIGVHESTVSRATSKKNPRFIQTEFGLFPMSYFFQSGVSFASQDFSGKEKVSAELVKFEIKKIEDENEKCGGKKITDQKMSELLKERGINIARRTVNKYRNF